LQSARPPSQIRENEFFTLLGPSGCGKTTLLRLSRRLRAPDRRRILLSGQRHRAAAVPRPVNTVFQNYALFPHMTVAEHRLRPRDAGPAEGEVDATGGRDAARWCKHGGA
jgi:ABC-type Fe3+/spermidine/putrescine transport system ATPase subunit